MKIKSKISIALASFMMLSLLSSCVNDDPYDFPNVEKPIVKTTGSTEFTVTEGETISIPFTVSSPVTKPMQFKFVIEDATAEMNSDYTIGRGPISTDYGNPEIMFDALIPPYSESFEIPFTAFSDLISENAEQVQVRMKAVGLRTALTKDEGILFTFNIEQPVGDTFFTQMLWDGTYVAVDGETYNFADEYDLDVFITDAGFNTILLNEGRTSASPEQFSIAPGDFADGDYLIVTDYYAAPSDPTHFPDVSIPEAPKSIPLRLKLVKKGVFNKVIDLSGLYTDLTSSARYAVIATLNIQGSTYTISDGQGAVIVQGLLDGKTKTLSNNQ